MLPRTGHRVVVKVGGSHATDRARIGAILREVTGSPVRTVIVPGGGPFADAVREAQAALGFSDRLAHKLAIEAMNAFAKVLVELFPALVLATSRREIDGGHAAGRIPVWCPTSMLQGQRGVPENWGMTSDSFAAWLAFELDAAGLVIVKSRDGPQTATPADLTAAGITDDAFPGFVSRLGCPVRLVGPAALDDLGELLGKPTAPIGTSVMTRSGPRATPRPEPGT